MYHVGWQTENPQTSSCSGKTSLLLGNCFVLCMPSTDWMNPIYILEREICVIQIQSIFSNVSPIPKHLHKIYEPIGVGYSQSSQYLSCNSSLFREIRLQNHKVSSRCFQEYSEKVLNVSWNAYNQILQPWHLSGRVPTETTGRESGLCPKASQKTWFSHRSTTKHLFLGSFNFELLRYQSCLELWDVEDKCRKRDSSMLGDCLSLGFWVVPLAVISQALVMKSALLMWVFIQRD